MTSQKFHKLFVLNLQEMLKKNLLNFIWILHHLFKVLFEEIGTIKIAQNSLRKNGYPKYLLAGGVALNCVANGKLLTKKNI